MTQDDLETLPGVGPATADKLIDAGYDTYKSIATASPGKLSNEADIGDSTANDVIQAAREEADVGGFNTGADVLEKRKKIGKLSWQIDDVDDLLNGGLETQSISEVYGEFGAGKSQVTHQMAVNVQLQKEYGGLDGGAIFIDSEDTFRPERIDDMVRGLEDDIKDDEMERRDVDTEDELVQHFLNNIHVAKAFNSNHQILLGDKAEEEIVKEYEDTDWPIRLMCVDSLTAHFRAEYVGRGELAERQQKLNTHLHDLDQIADLHNVAVLVTNQVAANPDSYFGDPTEAIGGHILAHASTYRMYLRKSKDNKRIVRLVDAPNLADGEAIMRVTDDGLKPE